ncbi:hypothetical protein PIB30_064056 [Stylosanthes scabra]|uniref:Uncharacterized protein n=1 Tax=Stylosanthes scabra TaxID=79078 RepID=A0ABU6QLK5_9FABA|nr:hypothetical protein [Stylosanthes scabra]
MDHRQLTIVGSRSGRPFPDLAADRQPPFRSACNVPGRAQLSRSTCGLPIKALFHTIFYHSTQLSFHSGLSSLSSLFISE